VKLVLSGDSHGEDLSGLKNVLNAQNPDLFIDLGDTVPKTDESLEDAIKRHKELDESLVNQEIPFIRLPGNYDIKPKPKADSPEYERDGFLEMLTDPSDFKFMDMQSAADRNADIVIEDSPTPHSYAVGVDDTLLIFSHAGLYGETPYAPESPDDEVDLNTNLYFRGEFIPETLEANYSAIEQFAKEAEEDYQDVVLSRGHEEIYEERKRETDEYGLHILTVGAYKDGEFATLETDDDINFKRRAI
jgi:hypothetical protein